MNTYIVSFYDEEKNKTHNVKVRAEGIVPAISTAQAKLITHGHLKWFGFEITKVEKI